MLRKNNFYLILLAIASYCFVFSMVLFHQSMFMKKVSNEIIDNWMPSIIAINAIYSATANYRGNEGLYLMSADVMEKREYEQALQRNAELIPSLQVQYEKLISSDQERTLYYSFKTKHTDYMADSKQMFFLTQINTTATNSEKLPAASAAKPQANVSEKPKNAQASNLDNAIAQFKRSQNLFDSYSNDLFNLIKLNNEGSVTSGQQGALAFERLQLILVAGNALFLVLLIISAVLLGSNSQPAIRRKIWFTLSTLALLSASVSGLFYTQLSHSNARINELNVNWLPSIITVNSLDSTENNYRMNEIMHVLSTDTEEMAKIDRQLEQLQNQTTKINDHYVKLISSPKEQETHKQFWTGYQEYLTVSQKMLNFSRRNENEQAAQQLKMSGALFSSVTVNLGDLVKINEQGGINEGRTVTSSVESLKIIVINWAIIMLLLTTIAGQLVNNWLFIPPLAQGVEQSGISIKWQLRLAFISMMAAAVFLSSVSNSLMQSINQETHELESNWVPSIILINAINTMTSDYRIAEAQHIMTTDEPSMMLWDKRLNNIASKISQARAEYEPLISSEEERNTYQRFANKFSLYMTNSEKMLSLSRRNANAEATKLFHIGALMFETFSADLLDLVDINTEGSVNSAQNSVHIFGKSQKIIIAVLLIMMLGIVILSIFFEGRISVALLRITGLLNDLSKGEVATELDAALMKRHDEIGKMANALHSVTNTLQALINDADYLINAAQAGEFSTRIDKRSKARHPGAFGKIIEGMNQLIELLTKPLQEIAHIMENMALGELASRIQGAYQGELKILKTNINRSLDDLVTLLSELSQTLQAMANSDLTHPLCNNYQGEFSVLKENTNRTITHMKTILLEITDSTKHAACSAAETVTASKYVASQASQQMAAIDDISRTIEETAVSIREIAEKSAQGNQLASLTTQLAADGQALLNKLIDLIQHMDAEYGKIEKITDQITRIADKTHLLSLNAGLEAMRAGENGVSFGFVAQQIGSLADEVSISAHNIGEVIDSSGQKIRLGVHAVQELQKSMGQIAEAAQSNEKTAQGISIAVTQQSGAIELLTQRVTEIGNSSNGTASAAEEISHTMESMSQIVNTTAEQAGRFKLNTK